MRSLCLAALGLTTAALCGCGSTPHADDSGVTDDAGFGIDAGIASDGGLDADGGCDSGVRSDAGLGADAGSDAGVSRDAGAEQDSGCGNLGSRADLVFRFTATDAGASAVAGLRLPNQVPGGNLDLMALDGGLFDTTQLPGRLGLRPDPVGFGVFTPLEVDLRFERVTVALVIELPASGRLLAYAPFDFSNQALTLDATGQELCARFSSSPSDAFASCVTVGPTETNAVVIVRLGTTPTVVELMFNGRVGIGRVVGTPQPPGAVRRTLFVGPELRSPLLLRELQFYRQLLSGSTSQALTSELGQAHAIQVQLGVVSTDACLDEGTPEFIAARTIIRTRCVSCHDGTHASWGSKTEQAYVDDGLVVRGNPEGSKLYYRLQGSQGAQGPKTMPVGTALSTQELAVIRAWLD